MMLWKVIVRERKTVNTKRQRVLQNEAGVTLIELLIAMALMSMVVVAAFGAYHLVQVSYERSRAYYGATNHAERAVSSLEKDLHQAIIPNGDTAYPVQVIASAAADADNPGVTYLPGQRMDIYVIIRADETDPDDGSVSTTTDRCKRIRYSLEADGTLRRGWVRQAGAPSGAYPVIAAVTNWRDIATGISDAAGTAVPANIFSDAGSVEDPVKKHRLITLAFWVKDSWNQEQAIVPVAVNTQVRSGY